MDNLFGDVVFEPGMSLLIDILDDCIKNQKFGFINRKSKHFSFQFILLELKSKTVDMKRKMEDDLRFVSTKIPKLHSLSAIGENLSVVYCDQTDQLCDVNGKREGNALDVKRKAEDDLGCISTKVRKLHSSLENLSL